MIAEKATRGLTGTYWKLVKAFPLIPIQDEEHLDEAHERIEALMRTDLDEGAEAYLEALEILVAAYEAEHLPRPQATAGEVLAELLVGTGKTQGEFAKEIGIAQSTLSAVIRGKRSLTADQAVKLSARFLMAPEAFLPRPVSVG